MGWLKGLPLNQMDDLFLKQALPYEARIYD